VWKLVLDISRHQRRKVLTAATGGAVIRANDGSGVEASLLEPVASGRHSLASQLRSREGAGWAVEDETKRRNPPSGITKALLGQEWSIMGTQGVVCGREVTPFSPNVWARGGACPSAAQASKTVSSVSNRLLTAARCDRTSPAAQALKSLNH
jgi:hypothetical protein